MSGLSLCVPAVLSRQDLRLDLQRLTEELFFVVPHRAAAVRHLVHGAVDVLWARRRCGESWRGVRPPPEYLAGTDATATATATTTTTATDVEGKSTRSYRALVFDLSAEVLQEMYSGDDDDDDDDGNADASDEDTMRRRRRRRRRRHKYQADGRQPPRTAADVKPILERHVLDCLGLGADRDGGGGGGRWGGGAAAAGARKPKDHVDRLLVRELREEEADWLDYDADELAVKLQLADSIYDSLLADTCRAVARLRRKAS